LYFNVDERQLSPPRFNPRYATTAILIDTQWIGQYTFVSISGCRLPWLLVPKGKRDILRDTYVRL